MGERNYIFLVNDNIYIYSHWDDIETLGIVLKKALIRGRERWKDRPYLNRIIFSEIIKDSVLSINGFGLSSDELIEGDIIFRVDVNNLKIDGVSFEDFIKEEENI